MASYPSLPKQFWLGTGADRTLMVSDPSGTTIGTVDHPVGTYVNTSSGIQIKRASGTGSDKYELIGKSGVDLEAIAGDAALADQAAVIAALNLDNQVGGAIVEPSGGDINKLQAMVFAPLASPGVFSADGTAAVAGSVTRGSTGTDEILFTALDAGVAGNAISIVYTTNTFDGAVTTTADRVGDVITISLTNNGTDTITATVADVLGSITSNLGVAASSSETSTNTIQSEYASANLTGGAAGNWSLTAINVLEHGDNVNVRFGSASGLWRYDAQNDEWVAGSSGTAAAIAAVRDWLGMIQGDSVPQWATEALQVGINANDDFFQGVSALILAQIAGQVGRYSVTVNTTPGDQTRTVLARKVDEVPAGLALVHVQDLDNNASRVGRLTYWNNNIPGGADADAGDVTEENVQPVDVPLCGADPFSATLSGTGADQLLTIALDTGGTLNARVTIVDVYVLNDQTVVPSAA